MGIKIYGLYDPTDNTESIRYVGKTIQSLNKRLQGQKSWKYKQMYRE